jgi:hypothetical protein
MATSSPAKTTHRRRAGDFEPAVVWYAVVATYVACVVGEALLTGGVWVSPLGPLLALFALPYALPASIFSLIPLYLWLRKRPATVLTSYAFVFGGAVAGLLWGALVLFAVAMARRDYFPLSDPRDTGYILLAHAVPGGVAAFIFSLFTYDRMARFAGKAWGRHRAESRVEKS